MAVPIRNRLSNALRTTYRFFRGDLSPAGGGAVGSRRVDRRDPAAIFGNYDTRAARYKFLRLMTENLAYSDLTSALAESIRAQYGVSRTIRPVMNPVPRIVDFWNSHLYPGSRDPAMGDGRKVPSSMPILAEYDGAREALAMLCEMSQFDLNLPIFTRNGAMLGDTAAFAVNDPREESVYPEFVDPENVVDYRVDARGIPYYYLYAEWTDDPRPRRASDPRDRPQVQYVEEGELVRDADYAPVAVQFRTYLKGGGDLEPFDWSGQGEVWTEEYDQIPLVLVPHQKVLARCPFGAAEATAAMAKIVENDDVASRFHTFLRKSVDPIVMFRGMTEPEQRVETIGADNVLRAIYAQNPQANAQMLLASLDLAAVDGHLDKLGREIEADYPELQKPVEHARGDTSGTALRIFLQGLETKGQTRRVGYDTCLTWTWKACLKMGGRLGYRGYEDWTPRALEANPGRLKFSIGPRGVFRKDELDELEVKLKQAQILESYDRLGIPATAGIRLMNFSDADIAMIEEHRRRAMEEGLPLGRQKQASPLDDNSREAVQVEGGATPVQEPATADAAQA